MNHFLKEALISQIAFKSVFFCLACEIVSNLNAIKKVFDPIVHCFCTSIGYVAAAAAAAFRFIKGQTTTS